MDLSSQFKVKHRDSKNEYVLNRRNNKYFSVECAKTGFSHGEYDSSMVEEYVADGTWVIIEQNDNMNVGQAHETLLQGKFVARKGWNGNGNGNGNGMYLFMIGGEGSNDYWTYTNGKNDNYPLSSFVAMKTSDDKVIPWTPSQTDFLAEDYYIVDENSNKAVFKEPEKFEFVIVSDIVYIARKSEDRKRYIVMWKHGDGCDCVEYNIDDVKRYIENGTWKITRVEIE